MQHFLTDKKYAMSDVAEVYLSINDLVEAGYASIVEKDGFWYWSVGGELIDPREHRELYKMDERTFRTLMKEFGYLDIYDEFKGTIKPVSGLFSSLAEFDYMGVKFEIYEDSLIASASAKFSGGTVAIDTNTLENNARISVKVGKPTLRDVHRVAEHVKELASVGLEEARRVKEYILRETGIDIPEEKLWVWISSKDYAVTELRVSVSGSVSSNRKSTSVEVRWDKIKRVLEVRLVGEIKSYYVEEAFHTIKLRDLGVSIPNHYSFDIDRQEKAVMLAYYQEFKDVTSLPSISQHYEVISNIDKVLSELLRLHLEKIKDVEIQKYVKEYYSYNKYGVGMTVGQILSALGWDPGASFDEVALKLIALKHEMPDEHEPPVFSYLVAQAVLEGHNQDKLMDKVNAGLETVMSYVARGRLSLRYVETPYGTRVPRVYLGGRELNMRVENLPRFEKMVKVAKVLVTQVEEEPVAGFTIFEGICN